MQHTHTQSLMRTLCGSHSTVLGPLLLKVFEILEVCALMLLIPFAFQADLWVLGLEWLGCRQPVSWWMACFLAVTSSLYGCMAFSWVPISVFNPLGLTFFQFFHPPTDSFEVIVHIDTQRPLQLCYTFAVCCTCAAFCLATLLSLIFTTVAKICLAVPVLTWCAVLLLMLRACSTEAQQGVGA